VDQEGDLASRGNEVAGDGELLEVDVERRRDGSGGAPSSLIA